MSMKKTKKISLTGILLNMILFIAKITVGISSHSLAVLSDAFNSLTDIISSSLIWFTVKISNKKADQGHPFGHHRAEPIAGLIVAIFAAILGFEIIKTAIDSLMDHKEYIIGISAIYVLIFTILIKIGMSYYFIKEGEKYNSPAIKASGLDSAHDVLVSFIALLAVIGSRYGMIYLDEAAAIFIGLFVLYSGYRIGAENIDYLMGKAPPEEEIEKIKKIVKEIRGVKGMNDIRAHYVGNFIHIEIHIEVNQEITAKRAHKIGKDVQKAVEKLHNVDKAFIHIDPK